MDAFRQIMQSMIDDPSIDPAFRASIASVTSGKQAAMRRLDDAIASLDEASYALREADVPGLHARVVMRLADIDRLRAAIEAMKKPL